jgi:serine/threonine protein kinase
MTTDPLGRYEILHELGRGAMGVVYKARDPLIDRTVAIKTINLDASMGDTEAFERRFYREAKSAGRLNHRNIVTIYDVGRSGDSAYIAMEFLEGRSLREIIDSGVVLPSEQVADIAGQIADGLACAHDNGVVHRDIKPANLMVLDNGTVKITDFGIAMLSRGSRTLGTVLGSPKYISPEQVIGQQPDGRSDIFSLGAVLYELLTGAPAFTASDLDAVLCQVINEMPAPPSVRNKNIARAFDRIVARAMAKHPNDRYATAREMLQELRNFRDLEMPAELKISNRTLERRSKRRAANEKAARRSASGAVTSVNVAAAQTANAPAHAARWHRRDTIFLGVSIVLLTVAAAWAVAPKPFQKHGPPPLAVAAAASAPMAPARPVEPTLRPITKEATPLPTPAAIPASAPVPIPVSTPPVAISNPPLPVRASRLAFAVSPWGEVYVDGRRRGISPPLQEVRLSPGKHVVEIRNTNFQRHSQTVDLEADTSVRIKHKFQ